MKHEIARTLKVLVKIVQGGPRLPDVAFVVVEKFEVLNPNCEFYDLQAQVEDADYDA